jgi:hypothetical protein
MVKEAVGVPEFDAVWVGVGFALKVAVGVQDPDRVELVVGLPVVEAVVVSVFVCE